MDQWILVRAEELVKRCRTFYEEFAFHKVYRAVYDFATVDLSSIYFDVLKDRLYTTAPKSSDRRSAQTALYRLSTALVRLFAPILTFTMEEVWPFLGFNGSVHTEMFPEPEDLTKEIPAMHRERAANWDQLISVREEVLKVLENARREKQIGAPLEARIHLTAEGALYSLLEQYAQELPGLFIVSQVSLTEGGPLFVSVERAGGRKCERCWKYKEDVGSSPDLPNVCAFCAGVLHELEHAA